MVKLNESKKSSLGQRKKIVDKRRSTRLARKKKKLRKKAVVPRSREKIAVGNVRLGTGKSVRKKIVSRAKKKSHGTLEETVMAERQEDFWKSRRIEEEPEESEDVVYGPREEEEISPGEFYGGSGESKYEIGGDDGSFYQSRPLEVLRSGSEKKREFDSSGNIVRPKKEKVFSPGVVRGVLEDPRDRMYSAERDSFGNVNLLATPEKLHDYDEAKKYK